MNKKTELKHQYLKNKSADMSVKPSIPREGMLGKDSDGNWKPIKVDNTGRVVVNVE